VNDPPVLIVAGAQSMNEDTSLPLVNAVKVLHADPPDGKLRMSLTVSHGKLTLASAYGLTFIAPSSNGQASLVFEGIIANMNLALSAMTYTPAANYNSPEDGPEAINVFVSDLGNVGLGGELTDTDTIPITVLAVNDAPVIADPGAHTVAEDASVTFPVSFSDEDALSGDVTVTISVLHGTLSLATVAGLSVALAAPAAPPPRPSSSAAPSPSALRPCRP
jgi:hypothetical protein